MQRRIRSGAVGSVNLTAMGIIGLIGRWYPVVRDLHRFFIAISGVLLMLLVLLLTLLSGLQKRRRVVHAVRDAALLPGSPPIWDTGWVGVPCASVTAEDVCQRPYSVGVLVNLHWPGSGADVGHGGVSYIELPYYTSFGLVRTCLGEGCSSESAAWASNFSVGCSFRSIH